MGDEKPNIRPHTGWASAGYVLAAIQAFLMLMLLQGLREPDRFHGVEATTAWWVYASSPIVFGIALLMTWQALRQALAAFAKRRLIRFSLRTMLILVAVVGWSATRLSWIHQRHMALVSPMIHISYNFPIAVPNS